MKEEILNYLGENPQSSMIQLCGKIPGFSGGLEWYFKKNTIIYSECSASAIKTMILLIKWREIDLEINSPILYTAKGFGPKYPIGRSLTKSYQRPRWVPLTFTIHHPIIEHWIEDPLDISSSGLREPIWTEFSRPYIYRR